MLMMFQQLVQVCQVMVIISFSSSITSLASMLPPGEVELDEKSFLYNNIVYYSDFTRNNLYGTIPVEWASMKNLSSISLTANRLSGNIPGYLGNFTALTYLYGSNLLYFSTFSLIYSTIASNSLILCSLMVISIYAIIKYRGLESNQFSGVVPPELGKLSSLKTLILSSNKLVGTLPEALAQIKDLTDFRVSDNNLNGTVPEFIGSWTQLRRLGLCATGFQGPIPRAIFLLENLTDLKISDTPGPEFPLPIVPKNMKFLYGSEEHQFKWNNPRRSMECGKNTVSVNFTHRLTSAANQI
ncbi:hypothetical protein DKX38_017306 [Salix brachista]|uniref:Malectin-like domain-containing protein n=1 Tax=Salix brachista TaxID=2182728 RepID=A0A5N5KUU5_9ROSI|nr:hypothetical protein DKX38_017306 [Salix brachista]